MGRKGTSYCGDTNKQQVNRGAWSPEEDKVLTDYVQLHGEGKWGLISKRAGLKRCGKSCRLRWLNYLKPDIKRGNISSDEEDLIIRLHKLLGNRWSLIAGRLPGRTDNEIKNYWNTYLRKKIENKTNHNKLPGGNNSILKLELPATSKDTLAVVDPSKSPHTITNKPKSVRCSKVTIPSNNTNLISTSWENQNPSSSNPQLDGQDCSASFLKDFDFEDLLIPFEDCHFNRNFGDYSIGIGYNENWKIDDFFST